MKMLVFAAGRNSNPPPSPGKPTHPRPAFSERVFWTCPAIRPFSLSLAFAPWTALCSS